MTELEVDRRARILRERARKTADRTGLHERRAVRAQAVVVRIGGEHFALPSAGVREIRVSPVLTKVPGTPAWLLGMMYDRGELVSVADVGRWFQIAREGALPYVAILRGPRGALGIGIDEVVGFRPIHEDELTDAEEGGGRPILGMTRDLVALIDVPRLCASEELLVR